MNVLVFGDSSALGKGMANTQRRWSVTVAESLREQTGDDMKVIEAPFFAIAPSAVTHAEKKLNSVDPDVVVILIGTYGIIMRSVSARVEDLFGKRAKQWTMSIEQWFERRSGGGETATGVRGSAFRGARWLAHHTIGTAALATPDEMFDIYRDTFALLARRENVQVVAVRWNSPKSRAAQAQENLPTTAFDRQYESRPDLVKVRDALQARIDAEVDARHFTNVTFAEYKQRTGHLELPELGESVRIADNGHEVFAAMMHETLLSLVTDGARTAARS